MKRLTAFLLLAILLILLPLSCSTDPKALISPLKTKDDILQGIPALEAVITSEIAKNNVLGLSIAVFTEDGIIYSKAFGYQNVSQSIQADTDTVYQAASISKTVAAYVAMHFVEQGVLDLDAPAVKYLDGYLAENTPNGEKITIRMLLNHTSGLPNDPNGSDLSLKFEPGAHFSYSGGGIRYLQKVLEAVTGVPFEMLADNIVFRPLGMESSSFLDSNVFNGHIQQGLKEENNKKYIEGDRFLASNAAYSLVTTPSDLAKLFMEFCRPTLIGKSTAEQMFSRSVKVNEHVWWGLGIGLQPAKSGDYIWHWGNNDNVFNSLAVADRASGTGVIIMASGQNSGGILREITAAAIGGEHYTYWYGM